MNKILFITHDTSRTGAPIILLYLLNWIKRNQIDVTVDLLAMNGGVLKNQFKKIVDNYYELPQKKETDERFSKQFRNRIQKRLGLTSNGLGSENYLNRYISSDYDVIYANTVISLPIAQSIKSQCKQAKIIAHIHELSSVIQERLPNFGSYIEAIDECIAPSQLVKETLINEWNVKRKCIEIIRECSEVGEVKKTNKNSENFIIGASGTISFRKGFDVFLQTALLTKNLYPNLKIKFIWVGGGNFLINKVRKDINKAGLDDYVQFIGEKVHPENYFNEFDIFLLTSREDPFPLVCIEAGQLGKPIVCFQNATGISEVLQQGGGAVVPYLSAKALTEKIFHYYKNREELIEDSKKAKQIFSEFTPDKICPIIWKKIKEV